MNDSLIRANKYTSTRGITRQQAVQDNAQLEAEILAGIDEGALADVALKLTGEGSILSREARKLMDMGRGLTAKDIDAIVVSGRINRQEGDMLLLATTLSGFDENAGPRGIAKAMNKFSTMIAEDQQATLNTFANQGSYERTMNVTVNADRTHTAAYVLSVNGQPLAPEDLPSTPDIQRAALFLMSNISDATAPGAIQAFTNWDFQTADDQMSALLGTLPSYENLTDTERGNLARYLAASGRVAAGHLNAANVDPDVAAEAEANITGLQNEKADIDACMDAFRRAASYGNVHLSDVRFELHDGTEVSIKDFMAHHESNLSFANIDRDNILGLEEGIAFLDTLSSHKAAIDSQIALKNMRRNGAGEDEIADFAANRKQQENAEIALSALKAHRADWRGANLYPDRVMLRDADGNQVSLGDMLRNLGSAWNDATVGNGMLWAGRDSDQLHHNEQDIAIASLENNLKSLQNDAALITMGPKADWAGASGLQSDMKSNFDAQKDMQSALALLRMAADDAAVVHLDQAWFKKADGTSTNLTGFLNDKGIDWPNTDNDNMLNNSESETVTGRLQDALTALQTTGDGLISEADDLTPPAQQAVPLSRNTDGGNESTDGSFGTVAAEASHGAPGFGGTFDDPDSAVIAGDGIGRANPGVRPGDWGPSALQSFGEVGDEVTADLQKGQVDGPEDLMSKYGLSQADCIDIGMLMFIVMGDRIKMLGSQIQDIIREQRKNTNDQADMNKAIGALNSADTDTVELSKLNITLHDGSRVTVAKYFDDHGVNYSREGNDTILDRDAQKLAIENAKNANEGLSNEGQSIMNELTQLSQKYQQANSLMMNFLEKFDSMKQKIIDKIRAN